MAIFIEMGRALRRILVAEAEECGTVVTHAVDWTPLPVPWAVVDVDRIPKQRSYGPEFFGLENEAFWPRVWQMACRLEEVPTPGDFVEYEILDQSIIVVRVDAAALGA